MVQVQFSSVAQSCLTLCYPMDCSTPGLLVHHQLLEIAQTHVLRVSDAIQPSHPCCPFLLLPSIFPSVRVFSSESVLHIWWSKYWSFTSYMYFFPNIIIFFFFCYTQASSSCGEQRVLSSYNAWASPCCGFSCCGAQALEHSDFSSCSTWAQ